MELTKKILSEYELADANLVNNFGPDGFILKNLINITDPLPTKVSKVICHYIQASGQEKNFISIEPEDVRIDLSTFVPLHEYLKSVGVKKESESKYKCKPTDQGELNQTLEEMITTLDKFINVLERLK